jgi:fluoride exporter
MVVAMTVVLVGLAGAAGAMSRYGVQSLVGVRPFPWATLVINVVGSLLVGFVLAIAVSREWSPSVVAPVTVGFLGAFTTFSTFTWETFTLGRSDRLLEAVGYVTVSIVLGLVAVWAGFRLAIAIVE